MRTLVVVPHTERGLRERTMWAICEQVSDPWFPVTAKADPFSNSDLWRILWRLPCDLIVCEQDVVPPPDSIRRLAVCQDDWCTHPIWTGERYAFETFGLVKFSQTLRETCPDLMDMICAAPDPRYWVRRGWTKLPRDCNVATLNGPGRRACLRPDAPPEAYESDWRRRPTTYGVMGHDVETARRLHDYGWQVHVHQPPATHLHDYSAAPAGTVRPWCELEYDAIDWPADPT